MRYEKILSNLMVFTCVALTITFFNIPSVFADDGIDFTCPKEVVIGSKFSCILSVNFNDEKTSGIQGTFEMDKGLSYVDANNLSDWTIASATSSGIMLLKSNTKKINGNIISVDFSTPDTSVVGTSYNIKLSNIILSDGSDDKSVSDIVNSIKVLAVANNPKTGNSTLYIMAILIISLFGIVGSYLIAKRRNAL